MRWEQTEHEKEEPVLETAAGVALGMRGLGGAAIWTLQVRLRVETSEKWEEEIASNSEYRSSGESSPEGLNHQQKALKVDKRERQLPGARNGY